MTEYYLQYKHGGYITTLVTYNNPTVLPDIKPYITEICEGRFNVWEKVWAEKFMNKEVVKSINEVSDMLDEDITLRSLMVFDDQE